MNKEYLCFTKRGEFEGQYLFQHPESSESGYSMYAFYRHSMSEHDAGEFFQCDQLEAIVDSIFETGLSKIKVLERMLEFTEGNKYVFGWIYYSDVTEILELIATKEELIYTLSKEVL